MLLAWSSHGVLVSSQHSPSCDTSYPQATMRMRPLSFGSEHVKHWVLLQSHVNDRPLLFTVSQYHQCLRPNYWVSAHKFIKGGTFIFPSNTMYRSPSKLTMGEKQHCEHIGYFHTIHKNSTVPIIQDTLKRLIELAGNTSIIFSYSAIYFIHWSINYLGNQSVKRLFVFRWKQKKI